MTRLKCKRVAHPPYSPDLEIADFDLLGVSKQKLQGIDVSDGDELKTEILTIVPGIPSNKQNKAFDHCIERCQCVAANARNNYASWP
jgi:hypothetical protein